MNNKEKKGILIDTRRNVIVISDMSSETNTEQETEVFSQNFVSAGRYRGGPHGVG